jgi:hypothetical protein
MLTRTKRRLLATLATGAVLASGLVMSGSGSAGAATTVDMTGTPLVFEPSGSRPSQALVGDGRDAGDVIVYRNVATIGSVVVDAVVTTVSVTDLTLNTYDASNPGSASSDADNFQVDTSTNAGSSAAFRFDFYLGGSFTVLGSGIPVVLQNVVVTSIDLDGPGRQWTEFTGFQTYTFADTTNLEAVNQGSGVMRFRPIVSPASSRSDVAADRVQVSFDALSSYTAIFGNELGGTSYFGLSFRALCAGASDSGTCALGAAVPNPANRPPTATDTTKYVTTGQAVLLNTSDFGVYSDPDANPLSKVIITQLPASGALQSDTGSGWSAVAANDEFTPADIEAGKLRYTGSVDDALQFRVHDGLTTSTSPNTVSLLVAANSQTITFPEPGSRLLSGGNIDSAATASSALPVTLTSSTPGVCTISGLDIVPVAAGTCVVTATQAGSIDYGTATPVTRTFAIATSLSPQTITFDEPASQTYSGSTIAVDSDATASSGLPVTLTSTTPSVCTIDGLDIDVIGAGSCTVTATQPGNGTYAAATPVTRTFLVKEPQTITFAQPAGQTFSGSSVTLASGATATSGLPVTLTSSTPSVCTVSGLNIVVIGAGTCTIVASQAGSSAFDAAAPVSRTFVIAEPPPAPVDAVDDAVTAPAGAIVTVQVLGNDQASGATITAVTQPASGSVAIAGSTVVVTPPVGFSGVLTFTYTISNGTSSDTATVTVTVPASTLSVTPELFIDSDGNGSRSSGEPGMPGVTMAIDLMTRQTASLANGETATGTIGSAAGDSTPIATFECTTTASGTCSATGLPAGSYRVRAVLDTTAAGVAVTADSDGGNDLRAVVSTARSGQPDASFGVRGTGSLSGLAYVETGTAAGFTPGSDQVLGARVVNVVWAGLDGISGTADDVTIPVTTAADGTYSVAGLPPGRYSITVPASSLPTGATAPAEIVAVLDAGAAREVNLPAAQAQSPVAPAAATLPRTGQELMDLVSQALGLVLLGVGMMAISRQRRLNAGLVQEL